MFPLRWFFTLFGFPLGGFAAREVVGPADGVVSSLLTGLLAGAIIGCVQWLALRRWGFDVGWAIVTSVGMSAGAGAAQLLTEGSTATSDLVLVGLLTGLGVGIGQALLLGAGRGVVRGRGPGIALLWTGLVGASWAVGWFITANVIVDAERGYIVFGSSGALLVTVVTGLVLYLLVVRPADAPTGQSASDRPTNPGP
jgi:hypothetical protein